MNLLHRGYALKNNVHWKTEQSTPQVMVCEPYLLISLFFLCLCSKGKSLLKTFSEVKQHSDPRASWILGRQMSQYFLFQIHIGKTKGRIALEKSTGFSRRCKEDVSYSENLPRDTVGSPSLEVFKRQLDRVIDTLT